MSLSRLIDWLTAGIALAAICTSGFMLFRKGPAPDRSGLTPATRSEWETANRGGHFIGSGSFKVVVVEFADFECPFCGSMRLTLDSLRAVRRDVSIRFRQYPLSSIHHYATAAALASECAASQGEFAKYHDVLYENNRKFGAVTWTGLAATVPGIDTAAFSRCLRKPTEAEISLSRDTSDAHGLHIDGTPVFYVGLQKLSGAVPLDALVRAVNARDATPTNR